LHARAAAKFVEVAQAFDSGIEVSVAAAEQTPTENAPAASERRVNGKSIMSVMLLAAGQGTEITLTAQGSDADAALAALDALIADKFGESS